MNDDIFSSVLSREIDYAINLSKFLFCVTHVPVFKKKNRPGKDKYSPVSISPNLSKVFESILHKQISPFYDHIFTKYQCSFTRSCNTRHSLMSIKERCLVHY